MTTARVKTSTGWLDLSAPGPQGPIGPTGPQGPAGPAAQRLLSHTEFTAGVNITSTNAANPDNVVSAPSLAFDGVTPVWVEFWCPYIQAPANNNIFVILQQDANTFSRLGVGNALAAAAQYFPGVHMLRKITPSAGSHVYRVGGFIGSAGTGAIGAGAGTVGDVYPPGFIRIFTELAQGGNIPLVSSLPSPAYDGQEVYYLADAANGVIWHLRYRAASTSAYKWEFVGGPSLYGYVAASESRASATNGDLTTLGPDVTPPLAGDYDAEWGARMQSSVAGVFEAYMSIPALGTEACSHIFAAQFAGGNGVIKVRKTITPAGTLLRAKYSTQGGLQASFGGRWLEVTPIRVG